VRQGQGLSHSEVELAQEGKEDIYSLFGTTKPPPPPKIDKSKLKYQKAVKNFDKHIQKAEQMQHKEERSNPALKDSYNEFDPDSDKDDNADSTPLLTPA